MQLKDIRGSQRQLFAINKPLPSLNPTFTKVDISEKRKTHKWSQNTTLIIGDSSICRLKISYLVTLNIHGSL